MNLVVLKAAIDRLIYEAVGRRPGERSEYTRAELDTIDQRFQEFLDAAEREVLDA
jgi:hypothetical protein